MNEEGGKQENEESWKTGKEGVPRRAWSPESNTDARSIRIDLWI